jgi:hypothetical protein
MRCDHAKRSIAESETVVGATVRAALLLAHQNSIERGDGKEEDGSALSALVPRLPVVLGFLRVQRAVGEAVKAHHDLSAVSLERDDFSGRVQLQIRLDVRQVGGPHVARDDVAFFLHLALQSPRGCG